MAASLSSPDKYASALKSSSPGDPPPRLLKVMSMPDWFASKRDLLDGFVVWERLFYERAVAEATAGLPAGEKLDAALRVIVEYQQSYPGLRMIAIEPAQVIKRLSQVIPLMRSRLERFASGPDAEVAVATAVRVAVSHYLVRSDDDDQFLTQLRHAAGVKRP